VIRPPSAASRLIKIDTDSINKLPNLKKLIVNGSFVAIVTEKEHHAVKLVDKVNNLCEWSNIKLNIGDPLEYIRNTKAPFTLSLDKGDVESATGSDISTETSRNYLCHASIGPC
ncbi:MAG: hypothetical protein VW866_03250, partial [Hyphomicrobiales bacterium]